MLADAGAGAGAGFWYWSYSACVSTKNELAAINIHAMGTVWPLPLPLQPKFVPERHHCKNDASSSS
jgi:hypothetical protein